MKAASAQRANLFLNHSGLLFWQDESNYHQFKISTNHENNLVEGPAARSEGYEWSSAGRPERPPQAEGLPHRTAELRKREEFQEL